MILETACRLTLSLRANCSWVKPSFLRKSLICCPKFISFSFSGAGQNSKKWKRVRQQVFISSCWAKTVYPQTVLLPPPHSSNCLGDSLRLEIKRTLFATVLMPRFEVCNTNKSANQPLRWDVDANSKKLRWAFCPASYSGTCGSCNLAAKYFWSKLLTVSSFVSDRDWIFP